MLAGARIQNVAPLVGAWIEILTQLNDLDNETVAPLVGAWIEILYKSYRVVCRSSLPSWERGLKLTIDQINMMQDDVAPLVGAWIEIIKMIQ